MTTKKTKAWDGTREELLDHLALTMALATASTEPEEQRHWRGRVESLSKLAGQLTASEKTEVERSITERLRVYGYKGTPCFTGYRQNEVR